MNGSRNLRARARRLSAAAAACVAAVAGCTSGPGSSGTSGQASPSSASGRASAPARSHGGDLQAEYQDVVRNVLPSVVQITTGDTLGSGIVYDDQGHIVTNAHVVAGSQRFQVTLATGGGPQEAVLVASYPPEDLAVVKLSSPPRGLKAAVFADSAKVEVGQIVLAMGNPLGLSSSVTQGIVSAVGRTVSEGGAGATIPDMVQTSAAINPGNSGGALVNLADQVIGIPTLAATDPQLGQGAAPGIGFAIPASAVTRIADQIIDNGKVTDSGRAALGIAARTVLSPDFQPAGVAIVSVAEGGAAATAGLRAGDVITRLDDTPVTSLPSLSEALAEHKPGDTVYVTYIRDGSSKTTTVTLGSA